MAAYTLEEQQQLDNLKHFGSRYGKWIAAVVLAAALAGASYYAWTSYQTGKKQEAATLFASIEKQAKDEKVDTKKLWASLQPMLSSQPQSGYSSRGARLVAQTAFTKKDYATADAGLQWVLNNTQDANEKALAQLNLISVKMDSKKLPEALKLAEAKPTGFEAVFAERKADVLAMMGKTKESEAAYQEAIKLNKDNKAALQVLDYKLAALGEK